MNKKRALILAALLAVALLLTGCGSGGKIEGKWSAKGLGEMLGMAPGENAPEIVQEFKDGKINIYMDGKPMIDYMKESMIQAGLTEEQAAEAVKDFVAPTYKVDGNKITTTTVVSGTPIEVTGEFKIEGDKLFMPDGKGGFTELTRVK